LWFHSQDFSFRSIIRARFITRSPRPDLYYHKLSLSNDIQYEKGGRLASKKHHNREFHDNTQCALRFICKRERSYSCREYTNYLTSYSSTVLWAQRWLLPKLLACLVLLLATTRMQSTKMAEHCFFKSRRKKAQRETLSRHVTDREIGVMEAFCVSHQSTPKAPIVLYTR